MKKVLCILEQWPANPKIYPKFGSVYTAVDEMECGCGCVGKGYILDEFDNKAHNGMELLWDVTHFVDVQEGEFEEVEELQEEYA
jgi:hypothetical protein